MPPFPNCLPAKALRRGRLAKLLLEPASYDRVEVGQGHGLKIAGFSGVVVLSAAKEPRSGQSVGGGVEVELRSFAALRTTDPLVIEVTYPALKPAHLAPVA